MNAQWAGTLKKFDQFRVVSKDLTRGSLTGGIFTAVAYAILILLLIAELAAFCRSTYQTNVVMDDNSDKDMKINFDITMFDLPCKHLRLSVWDKFGGEQIQSKDKFHYIPIDHTGAFKGQAYTSEELAALERADTQTDVTEEEKKDLDADWASSDDHFNHHDFAKAVSFHDFTLVNFYAEWCVHCRNFHPTWMSAKEKISEKMAFTDADGKQTTVKMLKINCVEFQAACQENKIAAFPSIRLYKRDGTFDPFSGQRSIDNIISFLTSSIKNSHLIVAHHHAMFTEGCKVTGWLNVPRAPGHFHLQADSLKGNVNVNPAFTNVSHSVNHLSFGERDAKLWATRQQIPKEIINHLSPLDNQSFAVEHFHQAPQHYLKVVTTRVQGKKDLIYQMTHTNRVRKLKDTQAAPQARFSYDISPLSVVVKVKQKRWYEFLTSLFAILGGTFTIVELTSGAVDTVHTAVKEAIGKDS